MNCEDIAEQANRPNLDAHPVYKEFFEQPELYERYHIHLVGVRPSNQDDGIDIRKSFFGIPSLLDPIPDPYVVVETVGPDTGSTDYFPIGMTKFPTLTNTQVPLWDSKSLLITKKDGTDGIKLSLIEDGQETVLLEIVLPRSELPAANGRWKEFVKTAESGSMKDNDFVFRIKVTEATERIVSYEDTQVLEEDTEDLTYTEEVLPDETESPDDNSLLQCWRQKNGTDKAVLWILGRNDCFMHGHVAKKLLFENNYDLYVLNYRMNGRCRTSGWVANAHYNSHNKYGDFNCYINEIGGALNSMKQYKNYETVLGYAHSTGGPILLNYLMEKDDSAFDGFIFNSPFLDWGFVGGDMKEFALEHIGILSNLGALDLDFKIGAEETPEAIKDTPVTYLGEEVVISAWSARIWSQYYFDWRQRPLFGVPMTVGFAKGVTGVHKKLEEIKEGNKFVTSKPFFCITSRGDDVLKSSETLSRADWIGPSRCEAELHHNGHDIFLSQDKNDTNLAIDMCKVWMENQGFI